MRKSRGDEVVESGRAMRELKQMVKRETEYNAVILMLALGRPRSSGSDSLSTLATQIHLLYSSIIETRALNLTLHGLPLPRLLFISIPRLFTSYKR